jgi:predicted PurR-regulated permease PerM
VHPQELRKTILFAILAVAGVVLLLWTMYLVRDQLLTIYVSALFATGLAPLVQAIERQRVLPISKRKVPRGAAILAIYATVVGLIAAVVAAALPPLIQQGQQLWQDMPAKLDQLQHTLISWGFLPQTATLKELLQHAPSPSADVVTTILVTLWGIAGGLFGFVSILLLTFFMLVESREIFSLFIRLFKVEHRPRVAAVSEQVAGKVSAWLAGQVILGVVIGVTSAIGLGLLGLPYFFLLAVVCGIGEMIPMVGPLLSAIPAVLVALTISPGLALATAVFFMAQQALENNVLVPRVMGQQVGLSAVTVIIALTIGSSLLGLVGALLAVPTAAILQVLFEELVLKDAEA